MLDESVKIMSDKLQSLLHGYNPCMILFGSVVLDDFKFGWSDIDFLLLTDVELDSQLAESLVLFRQKLVEENNNPYFRLFEGVIMTKKAFFNYNEDTIVYWGTSGQKLITTHQIDSFAKIELINNGKLLFGTDYRNSIVFPTRSEIVEDIVNHYNVIRKYVNTDAGWILDIARCLYTLRTNEVIAKTTAGEWALSENLCPNKEVMEKVIEIRKDPEYWLKDEKTKQWLLMLKPHIQEFANVLEQHLSQNEHNWRL